VRRGRKLFGTCLRIGFGIRLLQRANGFLECQAMGLEEAGSWAFSIPHDSRQHDRAIDLAAARLLGCLHGRVQDSQQFRVDQRLGAVLCPHVLEQPPKVTGNVRSESNEIDVAGLQDGGRIRVLGECQQQMLERYRAMSLLARKSMRPIEAFAKGRRHGYRSELVRKRLRHQQLSCHGARAPQAYHMGRYAQPPRRMLAQASNTLPERPGGIMASAKDPVREQSRKS
jgi:hypothetical protein